MDAKKTKNVQTHSLRTQSREYGIPPPYDANQTPQKYNLAPSLSSSSHTYVGTLTPSLKERMLERDGLIARLPGLNEKIWETNDSVSSLLELSEQISEKDESAPWFYERDDETLSEAGTAASDLATNVLTSSTEIIDIFSRRLFLDSGLEELTTDQYKESFPTIETILSDFTYYLDFAYYMDVHPDCLRAARYIRHNLR